MEFRIKEIFNLTLVLFFLFLISCAVIEEAPISVNNTYVSIPDVHFESQLIEQGIDSDGVLNQQILKTDAEQVSRLDLNLHSHFGEISDLSGIEAFVHLSFLSAVGQQIDEIDLSANTKLDTVFLSGNDLSNIDISQNPNLVFLDLLSNELNAITGLSQAPQLKELNVSWNRLEELQIQNASIEKVLASHNQLSSIDTHGALQLKSLLLTSNELTTVDFSANPQLEVLVLSDNQLSSLNIEENTHLKYLYSSSNALRHLDVSRNQVLIDLRVDRNPNLTCVKILNGQDIPTLSIDDEQVLKEECE
ncbi:MAG TPA: hypothetical protein VJ953_20690 [Saprospiraceae bacterium]|nr:hypothetical protein [Saprospiraceae bacterium]